MTTNEITVYSKLKHLVPCGSYPKGSKTWDRKAAYKLSWPKEPATDKEIQDCLDQWDDPDNPKRLGIKPDELGCFVMDLDEVDPDEFLPLFRANHDLSEKDMLVLSSMKDGRCHVWIKTRHKSKWNGRLAFFGHIITGNRYVCVHDRKHFKKIAKFVADGTTTDLVPKQLHELYLKGPNTLRDVMDAPGEEIPKSGDYKEMDIAVPDHVVGRKRFPLKFPQDPSDLDNENGSYVEGQYHCPPKGQRRDWALKQLWHAGTMKDEETRDRVFAELGAEKDLTESEEREKFKTIYEDGIENRRKLKADGHRKLRTGDIRPVRDVYYVVDKHGLARRCEDIGPKQWAKAMGVSRKEAKKQKKKVGTMILGSTVYDRKTYKELEDIFDRKGVSAKFNKLTLLPELSLKGGEYKPLDESHIEHAVLRSQIEEEFWFKKSPFKMTGEEWFRWTATIAEKNSYDPMIDYLEECLKKVADWPLAKCVEFLGEYIWKHIWNMEEGTSRKYAKWIGTAVFRQPVKRSLKPGAYLDVLPIFAGDTLIQKSTFIASLLPPHLKEYHMGDLVLTDEWKSVVENWRGIKVAEWAELLGLSGKKRLDYNTINARLLVQEDRMRVPYARNSTTIRRTAAVFGTVNPERNQLPGDLAAQRRFAVLNVEKKEGFVPKEQLEEIRDLLWGCAYRLEKSKDPLAMKWGDGIFPDKLFKERARHARDKHTFVADDEMFNKLESTFAKPFDGCLTRKDIANIADLGELDEAKDKKFASVLKNNAKHLLRAYVPRIGSKRPRGYYRHTEGKGDYDLQIKNEQDLKRGRIVRKERLKSLSSGSV